MNCLMIFIRRTTLCSLHTSVTTQNISRFTSAANCSSIGVPYLDCSSNKSSMYSVGSICLNILKSYKKNEHVNEAPYFIQEEHLQQSSNSPVTSTVWRPQQHSAARNAPHSPSLVLVPIHRAPAFPSHRLSSSSTGCSVLFSPPGFAADRAAAAA